MWGKLIFLLFIFNSMRADPPAFSFKAKFSRILGKEENYEGKYRTQMATLSADKKNIAISGRVSSTDSTFPRTSVMVFDINSEYGLENEKTYTQTSLPIMAQHLVSSTKCFISDYNPSTDKGNIIQLDFTSNPGVKIGTDEPVSYAVYSYIHFKPEHNLVIYISRDYIRAYVADQTAPLFPSASTEMSIKQIFTDHASNILTILGSAFHPLISSTLFLICGTNGFIGIIDTTKLFDDSAILDKDSMLFGEKISTLNPAPQYVESTHGTIIEFNHQSPTKFLHFIKLLSSTRKASGYYLEYDGTTILGHGYIDSTVHGLVVGNVGNTRNIIGTDFFLVIFIRGSKSIDKLNKIGIVDVGTISDDGKIDYGMVTEKVLPQSGLNEPYPNFLERVDSVEGIWIIGGGSEDKISDDQEAHGGWFTIFKVEKQRCHEDCDSCINEFTFDPLNCVTCSDNTVILGPSGCKCAENCLSCSENGNSLKCKACSKGYFLKDEDNDGVGECVEGEIPLEICSNEKTNLEAEKNSLFGNLETCSNDKTSLEGENNKLDEKIKELEKKLSAEEENSTANKNPPSTTINGVSFPGCVLSNKETGLCKMCARGFAKDTLNEDEDATVCSWCGVEGCDYCRLRNGDGKRICVRCLEGLKLQENNGVQTCSCHFLKVCFFIFFSFLWSN